MTLELGPQERLAVARPSTRSGAGPGITLVALVVIAAICAVFVSSPLGFKVREFIPGLLQTHDFAALTSATA